MRTGVFGRYQMPPPAPQTMQSPRHATFSSLEVIFGGPLLYVAVIMLVCRLPERFFTSTPRFLLKALKVGYNIFQIAVCSYVAWGLFPADALGNPFSLGALSPAVEKFVFYHYLTKYLTARHGLLRISQQEGFGVVPPRVSPRQHRPNLGLPVVGATPRPLRRGIHQLRHTRNYVQSLSLQIPRSREPAQATGDPVSTGPVYVVCCPRRSGVHWMGRRPYSFQCSVMYHPIMLYLFGFRMNWVPVWLNGVAVTRGEAHPLDHAVNHAFVHTRANIHTYIHTSLVYFAILMWAKERSTRFCFVWARERERE